MTHKLHNTEGVSGGEPQYTPRKNVYVQSWPRSEDNLPKAEQFYVDFAEELDIFNSHLSLPAWIFDYRESVLLKIGAELRKICWELRKIGLKFKIKYPIPVRGSWKFADIYFPRQHTVLMVTPPYLNHRPIGLLSNRAEIFRGTVSVDRVVEVESLEELRRMIRAKGD